MEEEPTGRALGSGWSWWGQKSGQGGVGGELGSVYTKHATVLWDSSPSTFLCSVCTLGGSFTVTVNAGGRAGLSLSGDRCPVSYGYLPVNFQSLKTLEEKGQRMLHG